MSKISACVILYHDLQFLEDIIEQIDPYVDEIVITDGPYSYNIDTFNQLGIYYDDSTKPDELNHIVKTYPKVQYEYKQFVNEEEKRIFAYTKCKNEIVLLVDTDELFTFNRDNLNAFINNPNKFVGGFDIYNMNRININFDAKATKFIVFKKSKISPIEHLDYTWLVGCKQNRPNIHYMDIHNPCGTIYHQTLNRNKQNMIIKYIFYVCLSCHINNNPITILGGYTINELVKSLSMTDILDIFYHSRIESLCLPSENKVCSRMPSVLLDLEKYGNNHKDAYFTGESVCLKNMNMCYLVNVPASCTELHVTFENVASVTIKLYEIRLGQKITPQLTTLYTTDTNTIVIKHNIDKNAELIDTCIVFNCNATITSDPIYKIKSITVV